MELKKQVDVCVVGAGHAGCEAALACARLGLKTVIFTVSVDSIAMMPCNPNIGPRDIWSENWMLWVERWVKILIRLLFSRKC